VSALLISLCVINISELRNHLDGVRDAFFAKESTLITVSEDYTVKMWDTKEFT